MKGRSIRDNHGAGSRIVKPAWIRADLLRLAVSGVLLTAMLGCAFPAEPQAPPHRSTSILVDDFVPQPYQGEQVYFFNRLEGDRGAINESRRSTGFRLPDPLLAEETPR